jgi:hypothetical protein
MFKLTDLKQQVKELNELINQLQESEELLKALYFHHSSQAKNGATPVSKEYHGSLRDRLCKLLFREVL